MNLKSWFFFWKHSSKYDFFWELWPLQNDENLPIIKKTKHPTKGKKKVQDGKTQVLANEESSKEGELLREQEQIMTLPPPKPEVMRSIMLFLNFCWKKIAEKEGFWTGFARPRAFSKSLARSSCRWLPTWLHHKSGKKEQKKTLERA